MRTDPWSELLREAGLRATAARLAVLAWYGEHPGLHSHADLVDALSTWDRATLWRNLNDLAAAGLLRRVDVGDRIWRFELQKAGHDASHHPHFVCVQCGDQACLDDVEVLVQGDGARGLDLSRLEVQLRGRCEDCASAG